MADQYTNCSAFTEAADVQNRRLVIESNEQFSQLKNSWRATNALKKTRRFCVPNVRSAVVAATLGCDALSWAASHKSLIYSTIDAFAFILLCVRKRIQNVARFG
jgi:hypothetical protein